jgi:hypothetical protein
MAEHFEELSHKHIDFIGQQHIFFVGTAGREGYVNLSPKGLDSFRVMDPLTVMWLNLTGSGNESAAHVLENSRMTIMFCSFDKQPLILRLYGQARVIHPRDEEWEQGIQQFPADVAARQIFELKLDLVQTSCGYAVPYYEFVEERPTLGKSFEKASPEDVKAYWKEKNTRSLDGYDTGIFDDEQ